MRRRASRGILAVGLILVALPLSGVRPEREAGAEEPWRLSWEERMTLRFSAGEQDRRLAAYLQARQRSAEQGRQIVTEWPADWHVIVGATDAEAMTPIELFDSLISLAFADDPLHREFWRTTYEGRIGDVALRESFWANLSEAIAPYLELKAQLDRIRSQLNAAPRHEHADILVAAPDPLSTCRTKATALAAARDRFSREVFDRILYEAVAPSSTVVTRMNQVDLDYFERGCQ